MPDKEFSFEIKCKKKIKVTWNFIKIKKKTIDFYVGCTKIYLASAYEN